jgi:HSP20 family molecular chaperone IbpA
MSTNQDVTSRRSSAIEQTTGETSTAIEKRTRGRELPIIPAVDIFEDEHELVVQAEMPGVSKDSLNVQADRNSLLIEGDVALDLPAGMSALHADLQTTKYRRTFALSGALETERTAATLKDGLLTVRIPKRAEFRTRKISVDVA